jgi:hypothetical protein
MKRDFTLNKYKELLMAIGPGDYTVKNYLNNNNQFAILRHDVDRPPKNVLLIAQLEHELCIKATYYFRVKEKLFDLRIITQVKELDHEVGYHYEVLDKTKGDYNRAIKIFKDEWKLFKKWDAQTICMHGNPFSKYVNRDIWNVYDFKQYRVNGEAYLSINFNNRYYFTDTGRSWNSKFFSVKDKISNDLININNTDSLIKLIKDKNITNIYILTHPSKWNNLFIPWLKELVWQNFKNLFKGIIVNYFLKK